MVHRVTLDAACVDADIYERAVLMTNPCTCKAEHWQPHADSCPAYKPKPLLTVENIRSGAVPADAVAAGFLLGENERLKARLTECEMSLRIFDTFEVSEYWLRRSAEPEKTP